MPKKPRVPKVAEIMPEARIIKPKPPALDENQTNKSKELSPPRSSRLEKDKSSSPKLDSKLKLKHRSKKRSARKKNKNKVIIYNAAGIPVAIYDNHTDSRRSEAYPRHD